MRFENILGNDQIKGFLKNGLERDKLSHTLLFLGIKGIGKSLFAKALAYRLMYTDVGGNFGKSSGTHSGISSETGSWSSVEEERIDKENHSDFVILRPDIESDIHKAETIYNLIDSISIRPYEARAKIFVIEDAEKMQAVSANALLKTLEEPPNGNYLILISDKEHEMLPTILSRCSKLCFSPVSFEDVFAAFFEKSGYSVEAAREIFEFSGYSLGRSVEFISSKELMEKFFLSVAEMFRIFGGVSVSKTDEHGADSVKGDMNVENGKKFILEFYDWLEDFLKVFADDNKMVNFLFFKIEKFLIGETNREEVDVAERLEMDGTNFWEFFNKAKMGYERNIALKSCLEYIFLNLRYGSKMRFC